MPYAVSKLAIALISPLGTALLLGFVALLWLLAGRRRRGGLLCLALALAWLGLWSLPAPADWLQRRVEAPYPPQRAEALPAADAIVVLGGGIVPPSPPNPYPDMNRAADRVWHAARLFKAGKAPLVLASGGSDPAITSMSEAQAMRLILADLGVPPERVVLEAASRNTQENAELSAPLLRQRQVRSILLVTSAAHMARSVAEFERIGVKVIPAPTDHDQEIWSGIQRWLPDTGALDTSARAMKEIVGLWAVRLRP